MGSPVNPPAKSRIGRGFDYLEALYGSTSCKRVVATNVSYPESSNGHPTTVLLRSELGPFGD